MLLKPEYHRSIYIFGLFLLAASVATSKFMISVSQIIMVANWSLEGRIIEKFKNLFSNKIALSLIFNLSPAPIGINIYGRLWICAQ